VIISGDDYNDLPGATPWGLAVVPATGGPPGFTVPLRPADIKTPGSIVVPYVMRCDTSALRHRLGFVSEETYQQLEHTLRDFLELP
jgi:mRNA-degrading endonuclease toxin of MazEF toxin-antitoxin module